MRKVVLGGLVLLAGFAVFDAVRWLLPATPIDVEAVRHSVFHRTVKVEGLAHLERATGYEQVQFYGHGSALHPLQASDVISRKPWLLVPLNRPDRSDGLLVVAELPLENGELPVDFDPNDIEFEGLYGPMPEDVLEAVWKGLPPAQAWMRLQVGARPSVWISLTLLAWALVFLGVHLKVVRGRPGLLSGVSLVAGSAWLAWFLVLRALGNPDANEFTACTVGLVLASLGHAGFLVLAGRAGAELTPAEFDAASALHDRLGR